MKTINDDAIERIKIRLATNSLYEYTQQAFKIIEPQTKIELNWHIELLCDYLQCVSMNKQIDENIAKHFKGITKDNRINYLLICFPPRCMKSILVSVMLITWHWIHSPHEKFLCGASSYKLSVRDSLKCRDIIQSDWYQERWGDIFKLSDDQNSKQTFKNTHQGERMAVSVDSKVTGSGGDLILADDLNDMNDIYSETKRESILHFWNTVFSTRENNPKTSRKIVMQQRGHAKDVAGDILSKEKEIPVTKLILKSIATEDEVWVSPLTGKVLFERKAGGLLWENRMGADFLNKRKTELSAIGFESQYQQSPSLDSGNIFELFMFKYLDEDPKPIQVVQSIDTAFKTGEENDYSVVQTWYRFMVDGKESFYLKSILKGRFQFPELKEKVRELAKRYKPDKILIEDKASGQSLIQELQREDYLRMLILPVQVDRDKVTRAYAITPYLSQGLIYLPKDAYWLQDYLNEMSRFPYADNDDTVDSTTQAIHFMTQRGGPRIREI